MIWFTLRQFRTQTRVALGALAVVAVVLAIAERAMADLYSSSGVATCQSDCATLISSFLRQATNGTSGTVYYLGIGVMYVVPALIGAFWGAPLIARELETGTHRLVWNQSITRTRWLATKLVTVGAASMATVGLLSLGVSWWARHVDAASGDRITPLLFGARDIVPVGYAAFAFALGTTLGMLIRRTVPAMAATFAGYATVAVSMPLWIRAHLAPVGHATPPLDISSIDGIQLAAGGGPMTVFGRDGVPGAWILSNDTITASGQVFNGPANPQYCSGNTSPHDCLNWIGTLNLRQNITYQPAGNFWLLQWTETGILIAAALLLAGFCFWWTRRRLI